MSVDQLQTTPSSPERSFLRAFAADLIDSELGGFEPELRELTRDWVLARIAGAGDVTRFGLGMVGTLLAAAVRVRMGHSYARLPERKRRELAHRLATSSLPLVADYVRAVRALAVTYAYEQQPAAAT